MARKKGSKWIQGAGIKKGAFTKKAKAAGMSVQQMAAKVTAPGSKATTETKRQANLAKTFAKMAAKNRTRYD